MCGISAVLGPADPENHPRLARMHEPIRHRGPDGEGFLFVDAEGHGQRHASWPVGDARPIGLGVAFRRLKILDLSEAAAQPLSSPDGRFWIAFNGEIYNWRALREELTARGRAFSSTGDTEVALAAYEAWGEECFNRLDGMWAIVLVDLARGRLVASRDRFGIKPLYWSREGPRLLLASEIKQILATRGEKPRAHAPLVARYLRGIRLPCLEETFFEGVRAVPPGTWFEVPLSGAVADPSFRTYWDLAEFHCPDPERPALGYADALEQFHDLLRAAVDSHAQADVTVGSLLSGGLDSSTMVSLLARARGGVQPFPTFSFGLREAAPELSELSYVDALVQRYGLENHRTGFDAAWIAANAPRAIHAMEEPPLALPALAQYRVFQLCREHGTTVVIDGQAADEVLGGYPYHQRTLLIDRLRERRLADFTRELRQIGRRNARAAMSLLGPLLLPALAHRLRPDPAWLAREYGAGGDAQELRRARQDRGRDPSALNRQLHYDVKWGNVKIVLGYSDRNAMAHSVEARVPYLDRRLVEFSFSQPDHYKVGNGERKRLLRDVARALLPAEITERPDRLGFAVPERALMGGPLWPAAREVILDGGLLPSSCFRTAEARRFVERFAQSRTGDVRALWRLYALGLWARDLNVALG